MDVKRSVAGRVGACSGVCEINQDVLDPTAPSEFNPCDGRHLAPARNSRQSLVRRWLDDRRRAPGWVRP